MLTPPKLDELPAGTKLIAGLDVSTILADFDFETYSPAGFVWNGTTNRFHPPRGATRKGLPVVGVAVYSQHPEAEVLSMAYDLKDGGGRKLWVPGNLPPIDLFDHLAKGALIEAWNVTFEYWVWTNICIPKYGWPSLPVKQLRCAAAKSRAFALPSSLADAGAVLNIAKQKDPAGRRLLEKFSMPRNPTLKDSRMRIRPLDDVEDAFNLYAYNMRDIEAEAEISSLVPDLSPSELEFWQVDQAINFRGVAMDKSAIEACMNIIDQARDKYDLELRLLTAGYVQSASEVQKIRSWMQRRGVVTTSLDAENIKELLKLPLAPDIRGVLEIRSSIGSAAVAKLFTMSNQLSRDNRLHELFLYHGARTGRAAGRSVQPQNLPNHGIPVKQCNRCNRYYKPIDGCPWCGYLPENNIALVEWNPKALEDALEVIRTNSLGCVEHFFGDAIGTIFGCIRGLFIAPPGKDLICSDFAAIEAVTLACLAGEQWQIDVFNTHGKIYEMTAAKISGMDFQEFELYKATSGTHHPQRKLGKLASLASGYGGWIGAWKAFNADEFLSDDEIKKAILAWRKANPAITEFWGGQERNWNPEIYGIEGAMVQAILNPGCHFGYRNIRYLVRNDILYCELPSCRYITYHKPRLRPSERRPGTYAISFEGWNTNPKYGSVGWIRMDTYSGKLTENICQAVARDILAHAMINLEKAGYPIVLHVHDEIVCEIPENFGSIEEFERIMSTMPSWAKDWPIKANGGWRGKRYGK